MGRAAYVVKGESFLDMNQVALQTGKSSESRFSVDGVLLEKAKKLGEAQSTLRKAARIQWEMSRRMFFYLARTL